MTPSEVPGAPETIAGSGRDSDGIAGGATLGAGEAVARVIAFAASLVVARRLGPASYGIIGVASGVMLYLVQLADQGIELVGVPAVSRLGREARSLVSATLSFRILAAVALAGLVAAIGIAVMPQPDGAVLAAYAPILVLTAASTRWVLLGIRRTAMIALTRVIGEVAALAIVLVVVRSSDDLTMVAGAAVAGLAVTNALMLIGAARAGIGVRLVWNWGLCRELFARGRPLVGFTLLGLVLFNFDLLLLRYVKGEVVAGEYAAAYAFISFASNLTVAYAHGVLPVLARRRGSGDEDGAYQRAMAQVMGLALPAAVGGVVVAGPLLHVVFGPAFDAAAVALAWLSLSLPFASLREVAVVGVVAGGRERALLRVNVLTVICNVALNVALVPPFGLRGAAAATVASEVIRLWLAVREASRCGLSMPPARRFAKPAVATLAMWGVLQLAATLPVWGVIALGGAAYAAVLTALGGVRFHRRALPELRL